jgi:glycosyltransferase involved in cell wall biosynthesis
MPSQTPIVSIIIPCYNQARYLPDALESILAQTLNNWECIVVDDGSPDDTCEVAFSYVQRDPRIRLVSQENRGLSGARNRGLMESKGEWIQFLDADDLIAPEKLELQVAALKLSSRPGVSYTDYRYCPEGDTTKTATRDDLPPPRFIQKRRLHDIAARWESEFSIPCHCFLFDATFFRDMGIHFDESLPNHEDWDCWMQVFAADPEVHFVEEPLAIYRLHNASMCTNQAKMWAGFKKAIRKQQRLFKHDPIMGGILQQKLKERRHAYQLPQIPNKTVQLSRLNQRILRYLRRITPWPIQRLLYKLSDVLPTRHPRL